MKKRCAAPAITLLVLMAGCSAEPFTREALPLLVNPNPIAMRDEFLRSLPDRRFTLDDTVIIQAPFHDEMAVLGEIVVDRAAGTFELVGLTHVGVTLFKLSGDHHGSTIEFAVPQLMEHKDLLLAMGLDIWRMFFDLTPGDTAGVEIDKTEVLFSEKTPEGGLVYEFGGDPAVLLEKHLDGMFGTIWRVRYFQYSSPTTGLYPHGIVMDNHQFHYRIIVKTRAMQ